MIDRRGDDGHISCAPQLEAEKHVEEREVDRQLRLDRQHDELLIGHAGERSDREEPARPHVRVFELTVLARRERKRERVQWAQTFTKGTVKKAGDLNPPDGPAVEEEWAQ